MDDVRWKKYLRINKEEFSGAVLQSDKTRALHRELIDGYLEPKKGDFILDLGCGPGWSTQYIYSKGAIVNGISIQPKEVAYADENYGNQNVRFNCCDMHSLPFVDDIFSKVYSRESFEHSISPWILINEVNRILKPEGIWVVNVPGFEWLDEPSHYSVLTKEQIVALCKKVGLKLIKDGKSSAGHFIYVFKKGSK